MVQLITALTKDVNSVPYIHIDEEGKKYRHNVHLGMHTLHSHSHTMSTYYCTQK